MRSISLKPITLSAFILTGAGKQFCAGADLIEFQKYLAEDHAVAQEPYNARVLWPVTQKLVSSRLPVIAAINGGATAGGLDLSLACDIRIASERAKLGETYIKLGLNPGNGGTYFLPVWWAAAWLQKWRLREISLMRSAPLPLVWSTAWSRMKSCKTMPWHSLHGLPRVRGLRLK